MDGIDDLSGMPRYRQVARIIESEIRAGQWEPGKRVPSRQQLADSYGIARETAARAHRLLKERGYLVAVHGVGMVVTPRDRWPVSLRPALIEHGQHQGKLDGIHTTDAFYLAQVAAVPLGQLTNGEPEPQFADERVIAVHRQPEQRKVMQQALGVSADAMGGYRCRGRELSASGEPR